MSRKTWRKRFYRGERDPPLVFKRMRACMGIIVYINFYNIPLEGRRKRHFLEGPSSRYHSCISKRIKNGRYSRLRVRVNDYRAKYRQGGLDERERTFVRRLAQLPGVPGKGNKTKSRIKVIMRKEIQFIFCCCIFSCLARSRKYVTN